VIDSPKRRKNARENNAFTRKSYFDSSVDFDPNDVSSFSTPRKNSDLSLSANKRASPKILGEINIPQQEPTFINKNLFPSSTHVSRHSGNNSSSRHTKDSTSLTSSSSVTLRQDSLGSISEKNRRTPSTKDPQRMEKSSHPTESRRMLSPSNGSRSFSDVERDERPSSVLSFSQCENSKSFFKKCIASK